MLQLQAATYHGEPVTCRALVFSASMKRSNVAVTFLTGIEVLAGSGLVPPALAMADLPDQPLVIDWNPQPHAVAAGTATRPVPVGGTVIIDLT